MATKQQKATPISIIEGFDKDLDSILAYMAGNDVFLGAPQSASIPLKTGVGKISGFVVNASSSGVIRLWDSTSATVQKILDSYSVTAGQIFAFPNGPANFSVGCYFELVSGTCTITFLGR